MERACAARRPRATPSSASARSPSCRRTSRATSTTCTPCARPSATRSRAALDEAGIAHASHYTTPLHLQPALRYLGYSEGDLPETEKAARENLCLPLWGGISAEQQERVAAVLRAGVEPRPGVIALPVTRHRLWQLLGDAVLIVLAWRLAFFLLFDQDVPRFYRHFLSWQVVAVVLAINLVTFVACGFYARWWRYVSTRDMWGVARGVTIGSLITYLVLYAFPPEHTSRLPHRVAAMDFLLLLALVAGSRLLARTLLERPQSGLVAHGKEVLIVGAGNAGQLLVREIQRNRALAYTPIGFVDDDPKKKKVKILGVRVLGTTDELVRILHENRPDEVLIAMPSAPGEVRRKIVDVTRAEGMPVKTLPGLHELISGDVNLATQVRPVQVEDVLGREPVEVDLEQVAAVRPRPRRARHRRRRLDRLGALPPARAARRGQARARRAGRVGAVRDRARAGRRARASRPRSRCSPTAATWPKMRQVFER